MMDAELRQKFDEEGEEATRSKVDQGLYAGKKLTSAKAWLAERDRSRKTECEKKRMLPIWLQTWSGWVVALLLFLTLVLDKCSGNGVQ